MASIQWEIEGDHTSDSRTEAPLLKAA